MDLENYIEEWVEALKGKRRARMKHQTEEEKNAHKLYEDLQKNEDAESVIKRKMLREYYFERITKEKHEEWDRTTHEIDALSSLLHHWRKKIKPDPVKPEVSRRTTEG